MWGREYRPTLGSIFFPSETNEDVPGNAKEEVVPYVYTNSAELVG